MPNGKGMSMLPHELAQPGKEEHSAVVACSNKATVMTEYSAIEEISYGSICKNRSSYSSTGRKLDPTQGSNFHAYNNSSYYCLHANLSL